MKEREIWLDYLRAFACILVSLGHLFLSFQESSIRNTALTNYTIQTVYHFHVQIFFFCSGYLLQKVFEKHVNGSFLKSKVIRCLDFLTLYIVFSGITFLIKTILSGDVNSPVEHSFLAVLLKYPINQMWYLYAISLITFCTPMVKTDRGAVCLLAVSLILKGIACIPACSNLIPVPFSYFCEHQIWYVLGILWAYKKLVPNKWFAAVCAFVFLTINTVTFLHNSASAFSNTLLTFTGVMASAGIFYEVAKKTERLPAVWKYLAKYMLQIYLLHTIFAAGIRIILLRLGIVDFWMHLLMGLVFSFLVPILCGWIAERISIFNVFFYPSKTLQKLRR